MYDDTSESIGNHHTIGTLSHRISYMYYYLRAVEHCEFV